MSSDSNYACDKCKKEYSGPYSVKPKRIDGEIVDVCPKGHVVKRIPKTSAPCPLCHEESEWARRDVNKVCSTCWEEIKGLRRFHEEQLAETKGLEIYGIAWHPRFSAGGRAYFYTREQDKELENAFYEMMCLLGAPSAKHPSYFSGKKLPTFDASGSISIDKYRMFTPEQAKTIQRAYNAINAFLEAAYTGGVDEGRNILQQIASGEMSPQDFTALDKEELAKVRKLQGPKKPKKRAKKKRSTRR